MKELKEIKIDRVELTMGGSVFDAHVAEFWEPYTYGQKIPIGNQEKVPFELVREVIRMEGEFFRQEYYVRAWNGNMPFITRAKVPICEADLLGYGLLTTDMTRNRNLAVRKIFGKLAYFSGGNFHDLSPQERMSEQEFFQNALTTVRTERERLMPMPRPSGNEAMWAMEELRNKYIELRSSLYWIGYDLEGFDEAEIEKYYDNMVERTEAIRNMPDVRKRKWFQNNLKEIVYLFKEHYQELMETPEKGYLKDWGITRSVELPMDVRKTSDEIVNKLNEMRLNLTVGRTWYPDVLG